MGSLLSCLRGLVGSSTKTSSGVQHPSSITVNGTTVRINRLLGEGGYAFVFAGTRHVDESDSIGTKVAVKRFVVRDAEVLSQVLSEVELHNSISPHPNIVSYIDHQRTRAAPQGSNGASRASLLPSEEDAGSAGDVWLVMEMAGGCLRDDVDKRITDFARERESTAAALAPFTPSEIKRVLVDLCNALAHLHGQRPPVAHHDVKLENILISDAGRYQLCDFGSCHRHSMTCKNATQVHKAESLLDATMTMLYRPPEACDLWQGLSVDTQADLWAVGVILYTMLAGKMPFDANPRQILAVQYDALPESLKSSAEYGALCDICTQGLLVQDPGKRYDLDQLTARLHEIDPLMVPTPTQLGPVRRAMPPLA